MINAVHNQKKKGIRELSINDIDLTTSIRNKDVSERLIVQSTEKEMIDVESMKELRTRVMKIRAALDDEKDLIVIEAIEKVFDMADHLDFMNRTALFIYIREISGLDKRSISRSMSRIRKVYNQIRSVERGPVQPAAQTRLDWVLIDKRAV